MSHEWIKKNFKYQETEFHSRFFDESENGLFEVPPRYTNTYDKNISLPDAPKWYVLQENKSDCVFCSFLSSYFFIGDKISADIFNDVMNPYLKVNCKL